MNTSPDVLIVGAGPVGLTLAIECCRHGVNFRIVDHHAASSDKSKALVIWSATLECLAAMGIVETFLEEGLPIARLVLADRGRILCEVPMTSKIDSPYPKSIFLPQSETEKILEQHLERLGKRVERGIDFMELSEQEESVKVELQNNEGIRETISVQYLAGCDGARSLIRHALPVEFEGETESLSFVLIDAKVEGDFPRDGMFTSWGNGYTVVFFPVKKDVFRMFTQRLDRSNKATPTIEEMQGYLAHVGLGHLRFYDPEWLSYFDINERVASRNRIGRVFLLGDAAHIHSPAGGQGMNTGMQDAFNLGWKMKLLTEEGSDKELVAESYFQERHPVAKTLVKETTALLHAGVANTFLSRMIKFLGASLLFRFPYFQRMFCEKLSEMNIHYRESALLEGSGIRKNKKRKDQVGWRVYKTEVTDVQTQQRVSLWDSFVHPGHTVLLFAGTLRTEEELLSMLQALPSEAILKTKTRLLIIASVNSGAIPGITFLDFNNDAHHRFGISGPSWLLVRPDFYVAARGSIEETGPLKNYFRKIGG